MRGNRVDDALRMHSGISPKALATLASYESSSSNSAMMSLKVHHKNHTVSESDCKTL